MSLKIKEGITIYPYGLGCLGFTSETELSQPVLEHLKTRFPNEIDGEEKKNKEVETKKINK